MYLATGFNVSIILCYIAGILSLMSMIVYIYQNREVFKDSPKED
jgi:phosphatidylglycerophosphate synthase